MSMLNTSAAAASTIHAPVNHLTHKRHSSLSSSSVVTVKRSQSFNSSSPSIRPAPPPPPPPFDPHGALDPPGEHGKLHKKHAAYSSRRRSSLAHVASDSSGIREGIGNLNRWSQSTTSSLASSGKDNRTSGLSRRLSIGATPSLTSLHGSSRLQSSPPPKGIAEPRRSPEASPQRRPRPYSPPPSARRVNEAPPASSLPSSVGGFDPSTVATPAAAAASGDHTLSAYAAAHRDAHGSRALGRASPPKSRPPAPPGQHAMRSGSTSSSFGASNSHSRTMDGHPYSSALGPPFQPAVAKHNAGHGQSDRRNPSRDYAAETRDRSVSDASSRFDDDVGGTPPRHRERREKDKKGMLSRALQKANTAVLLDNAQNFEGAMEAYGDACRLLQQVMIRSPGEEDRRKLEAIRVTYTNRIQELRQLEPAYQMAPGKSLPSRPMSNESLDTLPPSVYLPDNDDDDLAIIGTAVVTRIVNDRSIDPDPEPDLNQTSVYRESIITTAIREVESVMPAASAPSSYFERRGKLAASNAMPGRALALESPMDRSYMPPPLSPRRPLSPNPPNEKAQSDDPDGGQNLRPPDEKPFGGHSRMDSSESVSWLDTIDESGGSSCSSSVHSVSSRDGLRRKFLQRASGATEAEFDAALDAAVEAAYDDGLEPYEEDGRSAEHPDALVETALRSVELAKEKLREVEREDMIAAARYRDRELRLAKDGELDLDDFGYLDEEAQEEERMLEEMTKEYMLEGFDFDLQSKSALPRQSDSSAYSATTWASSMSSHRTTAGTSLSTVAEFVPSRFSQTKAEHPPPLPPPTNPLPPVSEASQPQPSSQPTLSLSRSPSSASNQGSSVRTRRLSGQNPKQLKIETSLLPSASHQPPLIEETPESAAEKAKDNAQAAFPKSAPAAPTAGRAPSEPLLKAAGAPALQSSSLNVSREHLPEPASAVSVPTPSPAASTLSRTISNDSTVVPSSPGTSKFQSSRPALKKNKSSLSLKNRTISVSSPDGSDASVSTPMSTTFTGFQRKGSYPQTIPTPSVPTFNLENIPTGGMHLFEIDIHSPYSPGAPNPLAINAPIQLEPCPDSCLLRPFWLMRCLYQTIAHPRGGYLSTKLFIPRDVWRVKGVKIKAIEEKAANCDLLTAALQKLATVDTYDADAVLEEMQAFEPVMDQAQTNLAKKLGNDVGVHGVSSLFKDAHGVGGDAGSGVGHTSDALLAKASSQSKSTFSWRKLRPKNSAVGLAASYTASKEVPKDALTMSTLPMTSLATIRFAPRDVSQLDFAGQHNGNYLASLVRLFDAAQFLDQVARQVEDPGLKHSSQTHVGLELCTRHAAEFFGFHICRFVLADLSMMLDKFIKKGSEWVLV